MKLNYKRTLLVGFAFFLICVFWQAYDAIIPILLTNKFGLDQTVSGLIMSLDNILALFMLPIFGALSDKINTKHGKRTPFIFIGTILAIVCFVGLSFVDLAQKSKLEEGSAEIYWEANYEIDNREYHNLLNNDVEKKLHVQDYASRVMYNKDFDQLTDEQKVALKNWYITENKDIDAKKSQSVELDGLTYQTVYSYDKKSDQYTLFATSDKAKDAGVMSSNCYSSIVSQAESKFAATITKNNVGLLVVFIIVLLFTLISMATFRSPAVALMPDVTVKPLRSKANAIINLMGTAGGILVLGLGKLFGTSTVKNQLMSYTPYVLAVCGIMAIALVVFIFTVKEKRWSQEMLDQQALLDAEESNAKADETPSEDTENTVESASQTEEEQTSADTKAKAKATKLPKDKLISLIFILASVALWFTGYNAITSKYSVYALNILNKDYNMTLIIAQAAAVVAYIPVGMVASKLGRKKTILIGIGLLFASFFGAIFIDASAPAWLISVLFALAGIAWATINVNSFPMVVELAQGSTIGKYTGYYYTASMAAQVITPILSGWLMDINSMQILFPYATIFVGLSFVTMLFVKHGDSKPDAPKDKMEMLGGADD